MLSLIPSPMSRTNSVRGRRGPVAVVALLILAMMVAACGGGGGNLPSSVPGSLPASLPTTTRTTSSQPITTSETATATLTATVATSPPESASNSKSETPWGWIAAAAILLVIAALIGGWAFGRRGGSRKTWRAQARQANVDGTALHDTALGELIAATSANRPEQWSVIAAAADNLSATLQRLEASSPDDQATRVVRSALEAVVTVRSAIAIARAAPPSLPLDEEAGRTLRQRLEELAAALRDLRAYAQQS